jgi:exosortase B
MKAWAVPGLLGLGWLALFGPSYAALHRSLWATDTNGHGPVILAVAAWLLWRLRPQLAALPRRPAWRAGAALFAGALLMQVLGRSQALPTLEMLAQNLAVLALLLLFFGWRALRLAWFALVFLMFMVPWPAAWVDAVTQPLKAAVSSVAVSLLHLLGYPVGRAGVIITVGPYQLLVADACAGLNSLFTLEALGLLYINLMGRRSWLRNTLLTLTIPLLAFAANVVRVLLLVLITFHAGEAAGRGFGHSFAGMTLFGVALLLVYATDGLLGRLLPPPAPAPAPAPPLQAAAT